MAHKKTELTELLIWSWLNRVNVKDIVLTGEHSLFRILRLRMLALLFIHLDY